MKLYGPLNRLPRGLLNLVDLQSNGRVPDQLRDEVQATLEMTPFYEAQLEQTFQLIRTTQIPAGSLNNTNYIWESTAPLDITTGANLIVPNNEMWVVKDYTAFINIGAAAADFMFMRLQLFPAGASRIWIPQRIYGSPTGTSNAAVAVTVGAQSTGPFVAQPGSSIQVTSGGHTLTAAATLSGSMRVIRLRL